MSFGISINFDGSCREAVTFYADLFGLPTPVFVTYGEGDTSFDTNVDMSEEGQNRIMFSSLNIEGVDVMFSDMPDNFDFVRGNSMTLTLTYQDTVKAQAIFDRLAQNGQVFVPFAQIPGHGHYGMLADSFGLSWIIQTSEI